MVCLAPLSRLTHEVHPLLAFGIIAGTGFALLLLSLTVGEVLDFLDISGDAGISTSAIGAALTFFGATGVIGVANGLNTIASIFAALLAGAAVGAVTQVFINRLQDDSDGDATLDATGLTGVTTTTTGPAGGEVRLDGAREVEARLAWATTDIAPNTRVRVTTQNGSRVQVEPITD